MNLNDLTRLGDAIGHVADETDTDVIDVINALTGICFDEEEAGDLKRYHAE